jgi:hypothetical protein
VSREPARDRYDAIVDLFPPKQAFNVAYAIVKVTYQVVAGEVTVAPPEPLLHDLRDADASPRMPPGSDFWLSKDATDVAVLGSAYARTPVQETWVALQVGRATKYVKVFGQRHLEWTSGPPRFSAPEPFEVMAITKENAYGGYDGRVPVPAPRHMDEEMELEFDHPGLYPRNPFGKGYVVIDEPADGVALPNLEDPEDLLTPERIVVGDPALWWRQPLPWTLDWHHPLMFPRYVYLGGDAWFPGPEDASIAEVARGFLAANYRRDVISPFDLRRRCPPGFYREASLGMSFAGLSAGTPISVTGMHPDGSKLEFALPGPPKIEIAIEKDVERIRPQLTNVVIEPADNKFSLTWVAQHPRMPRKFIPGIHAKIPLILWVDDDEPIIYETPPTIRDQLAGGKDEPT